jgi:TonB-dependent SusC/RagA subfamily outer membrane receptor
MKISLVVAFTLCLAGAAGAQQTPICVVDGARFPCVEKVTATQQAPAPLCIIDGMRYPSTTCTRDWSSTSQVFVYGGTTSSSVNGVFDFKTERADILHVEIIKGPTATAQYGPDAVNGVILITTNRAPGPLLSPDDPLAHFLFPPELVMAHQKEISLTDTQRSAIQRAIGEAQGAFVDLKFKVTGDVEQLQRLLEPPSVDLAKVMEQVDRVLAGEREIKRAQLTLLVRIKNQLTEQQQAALGKLR